MNPNTIRLLIACPDRSGIIAAAAGFISRHKGNILDADQHSDKTRGEFFMRLEIDPEGFDLHRETFEEAWKGVAQEYAMRYRIFWGGKPKRMAILVSRESHCLNDLLWRWKSGELMVEIPVVISNHAELEGQTSAFGVAFRYLPVDAENRRTQQGQLRDELALAEVDFVVLARYMQVLPADIVSEYRDRIINIHHSFLPAFAGPRPYHQAYERGVKLIGATSHYVTDVLDEGPIIAQATLPIDHRDSIEDLIRKGRDLERVVLASAVRQHVEDKILLSGNRTIVFG